MAARLAAVGAHPRAVAGAGPRATLAPATGATVRTGATLATITGRPDLRALCRAMMLEAQVIAESLGTRFAVALEKRIDGAAEVGEHKTSMLQDLERGRPMEIDALLGAVVELGTITGHPTPTCDTVLALVRQRAREAGCYDR